MNLEELRKIIDEINSEIIALFSKRLEVAKEIAKVKMDNALPIHDPKREERQLRHLRHLAKEKGLSPSIVEEIFNLFVAYSRMNMKMEVASENKNRLPRN